ncbi:MULTISPECIES: hypothetical protein [unclassified Frigoribacterium]|uniref:hypothetical protein n=1 Tax=unclassified Frigoribacterium TaxID=2627005 RepID=UPI000F48740D|nr:MULTISPECIES: hypothetical protein [unclassified Frigoribacterium]ROP75366.1 flagellar assembly protein FliH [Frigoribacterium sp. PhB107]TDT63921.1 flagellar assembly protein FliH [Frigoribacterium sp. PhB116]
MLDPAISASETISAPESFSRVVYPSLTEVRSGSSTTAPALDPGHAVTRGAGLGTLAGLGASAQGAAARSASLRSPHAEPDAAARAARAEARGHAAGYAAGLRAAEADLAARRVAMDAEHVESVTRLERSLAASFAALDSAADALRQRVAPVLAESEEALVQTALDLASAVVGYEVAASEPDVRAGSRPAAEHDGVAEHRAATEHLSVAEHAAAPHPAGPREGRTARAAVARALDGLDRSLVVGVRLHPADLAALGDAVAASAVPLVADARLARGDAEVDLPAGLVDARLVTALARARTALLGAS